MPQPEWEALEGEVRDIARRVARIERELGIFGTPEPARVTAERRPGSAEEPLPALPEATALFPIVGRALLGLAGAYLLRALTEAGTLPHRAGVAVGLLYAMFWLILAARTPAQQRIEAAVHSLTSVLVLAPLLWEATLRFQAISSWAAGAILTLFTVVGLGVSWRKNLLIVATIVILAGVGAGAALLMATRDVLPFTAVLLAIAAAVEISACLDHWLSERWLAATAANLSVLLATWLVTNARGLPPAYAPIPHAPLLAAQAVLLGIYLSSTIVRTLVRGSTVTNFEIAQCALAFIISVGGGLRLSTGNPTLGTALALLTLSCAAACYIVSFARLDRSDRNRNFYTYSTFGILLALAGSRILLSPGAIMLLWPALAVAAVWAGGRFARLTLQVHGAIYLTLSLIISGALLQAGSFVVGKAMWPGRHDLALAIGAFAAALCYCLAAHYGRRRSEWNFRSIRMILAMAWAWLLAGAAAGLLTAAYHVAFGPLASDAYCATIRTAVVSCSALALAWAGSRLDNWEFLHLAYPAMALGAYRLVTQDLRQDRTEALFLSLLLYGAALIALPRLRRAVPRTAGATAGS